MLLAGPSIELNVTSTKQTKPGVGVHLPSRWNHSFAQSQLSSLRVAANEQSQCLVENIQIENSSAAHVSVPSDVM